MAGVTPPLLPPNKSAAAAAAGSRADVDVVNFNWEARHLARGAMDTLVLALTEDPVNAYFCDSKGSQFAKDEVKGYLKALPGAAHFIMTPDAAAAALWQLLPEETPHNELWAGWTRVLKVPLRLWPALLDLELHYEAAHAAVAAARGSYFYLSFIGTLPQARGRGLGGRLIAHITTRADAERRVCLLEATSPRSRALYERHGFICYEEFRVRPTAPPVFFMLREPAAAGTALPGAVAAAASAAAAATAAMMAAKGVVAPLTAGGADVAEPHIGAVRSVRALQLEEERALGGAGPVSAATLPARMPETGALVAAGEEDAVVMSHGACPAPSTALVHAMSLKQAAATALALAAAACTAAQDVVIEDGRGPVPERHR